MKSISQSESSNRESEEDNIKDANEVSADIKENIVVQ